MRFLVSTMVTFLCLPVLGQQSLPPGSSSPDQPAHPAPTTNASTIAPELASVEDKIAAKQFDSARPLLLKYLQTHPADGRALFDLGYVDSATNQDTAAEQDYRKAITADPQQFESRLALGLMLAARGDNDAAREQLQAATERTPTTPNPGAQAQAYRALAQEDVTANPAEAKQALLSALKLSPETEGDLLLTARIASASGDRDTAEAAFRRLLVRQPDSVEGMAGLSHILLEEKKYDDAEPLLRSALARIPDDPGLNMQLASLLASEGKPKESEEILEKLHSSQPDNASVSQMLADDYMAAKDPVRAEPLLAAALKLRPDDVDLLDEEGEALIYEQRFADAIPILEHATSLRKEDADAWGGLAFAHARLHQDEATLQSLAMRAKSAPDTASTLFLRATSYDNLHQEKLAAEYYQKFLDAANGKFPDQEWQAKHRLIALAHRQ